MTLVNSLLQRYRTGGDQSVLQHTERFLLLVVPVEAGISVHHMVQWLRQITVVGHVIGVLTGQAEKQANLLLVGRDGKQSDFGHFHRIDADAV